MMTQCTGRTYLVGEAWVDRGELVTLVRLVIKHNVLVVGLGRSPLALLAAHVQRRENVINFLPVLVEVELQSALRRPLRGCQLD